MTDCFGPTTPTYLIDNAVEKFCSKDTDGSFGDNAETAAETTAKQEEANESGEDKANTLPSPHAVAPISLHIKTI